METFIEILKHLPLCFFSCLVLHIIECNSKTFHNITHLHWLRRK